MVLTELHTELDNLISQFVLRTYKFQKIKLLHCTCTLFKIIIMYTVHIQCRVKSFGIIDYQLSYPISQCFSPSLQFNIHVHVCYPHMEQCPIDRLITHGGKQAVAPMRPGKHWLPYPWDCSTPVCSAGHTLQLDAQCAKPRCWCVQMTSAGIHIVW